MEQKGLVSVIIPAFNAARSLARCIDSVLSQSYKSLEVIVINDGSVDGTEAVAREYGSAIRYLSQDNKGETAARNRGLSEAQGEFVALLDHDDYWLKDFLASCVDFLTEHEECVAVSGGSRHVSAISGESVMPAFLADGAHDPSPQVLDNFFEFWAAHNHICVGAAVLRGSLVRLAGGQRGGLALSGDLEYWAYLATFGKWGFIPRVMTMIDGTQAALDGMLYRKFFTRYLQCPTVERWQERILPRLSDADKPGFAKIRGLIATNFVFANIFVSRDREAYRTARIYSPDLVGRMGRLWKMATACGAVTWIPMCLLVRIRTRLQYRKKQKEHREC